MNFTDDQIRKIMYALTLLERSNKKQQWINNGFRKIKADNLFKYWKNRIEKDEIAKKMAESLWGYFNKPLNAKILPNKINNLGKERITHIEKPILQKEIKLPSLKTQIKNFSQALIQEGKAIASGEQAISEEDRQKRIDICKSCDKLITKNNKLRCSACGCYVEKKAAFRSQKCPLGKW